MLHINFKIYICTFYFKVLKYLVKFLFLLLKKKKKRLILKIYKNKYLFFTFKIKSHCENSFKDVIQCYSKVIEYCINKYHKEYCLQITF